MEHSDAMSTSIDSAVEHQQEVLFVLKFCLKVRKDEKVDNLAQRNHRIK